MFQTIYNLFFGLFEGATISSGFIELCCALLSTTALVFLCSLPFVVVFFFIKMIFRRF